MRLLPMLAWLVIAACAYVTSGCREEKHPLLPGTIDPERFPTMRTQNVSTLISDSGITRYKITSPLWLIFDESRVPQWKFPRGLHLEKYDDFFRKDATVDADSATYFKDKQTWRLDGYVRIANMAGEKFLTPQLFWDQKHRKIYSDSFIHIEKSDRIIEGYGFESNERMTDYKVRNVSGIFPIDDFKGHRNDSTGASQGGMALQGSTAPPPTPTAQPTHAAQQPMNRRPPRPHNPSENP